MINQGLDIELHRKILTANRRVQIRGFLQEEVANSIRQCLQSDVPWTLAYRVGGRSTTVDRSEYALMDDDQVMHLLREASVNAKGDYGFAYETYMMVKSYLEKLDEGLLLHRILELLNSEQFLGFARAVTGIPGIRRVNAQATRYRAGHFLRMHDDADHAEGRLVAYVINMTPSWHPDWGGLLHFMQEDGAISEVLFPFWNSMNLFLVPQLHFVSGVMPYAESDRLSITGWFQS